MARDRKQYEDDDGRTVADMSDVGNRSVFSAGKPRRDMQAPPEPSRFDRPWEEGGDLMTPKERRWYILGALKAALLIALAFIGGLGLVILLILWFGMM